MDCDQCGRCCMTEGMGISATLDDIERWNTSGFRDIFRYMHPRTLELWVDARTLRKMERCPYLLEACCLEDRRPMFFCAIQDIKPQKCKAYRCLRKEIGAGFSEINR